MPVDPNALGKLSEVEVAGIQQAGNLQVFGLRWLSRNNLDYLTLDEALQDRVFLVTEASEEGQVPAVKVSNKSDKMVFLMAGELLVGCKQDRVLNTSMMVPSRSEMPIPVACVEGGRWAYRSRRFSSGGSSSHSYLRMMLVGQASRHYKARGTPGSDQAAVWKEVRRKMGQMGSSSDSAALQDMFGDYARRLDQLLLSLCAPNDCQGAAFAINGSIVGVDLFDRASTLIKLWSKLVKGYAIDALGDPQEKPRPLQPESVSEWLRNAGSAKQQWFDSPGLGRDVRIEGEQLVGAALIVGQEPVHLVLLAEQRM